MAKAGHEIQAQKRRGAKRAKGYAHPSTHQYVACTRRRLRLAVAFTRGET
jgi:hypothetical protein